MMKKITKLSLRTVGVLFAFVMGQVVQLVLHGMVVSMSMWDNRRVIFCAAGGFVILAAVIAGVIIASEQDERLEREYKHEKAYLDYAEIPQKSNEVVSPIGR